MALTVKQIEAAKPKEKPYKLHDSNGLDLYISTAGGKYWKLRYQWHGKEKKLTIGRWPDISLADARLICQEKQQLLRANTNPASPHPLPQGSFQAVAVDWMANRRSTWSDRTYATVKDRLERFAFPTLGHRQMRAIEAPDILTIIREIELEKKYELAHRVHQYISQAFRFGIATGRASRDPAADLRGALVPSNNKTLSHLAPNELPDFMKALQTFPGGDSTKNATLFLLLTFVRTTEMRFAAWKEIDGDVWRIPADRMKMKRPHLVPLSKQALALLEAQKSLTGAFDLIFATPHTPQKPISENAVLYALHRMGYKGRTTGHGFRSTASTVLNESGFNPDAIERQLAHVPGGVRAVYNHAQYMDERKKMMQWWADYLDAARDSKSR